jgi:hypothetical protein
MFMKNRLTLVYTCCISLVLFCCVKPAQDSKVDLQEVDSDCQSCINTPILIEIDNALYQLKVDTANNLTTIACPFSSASKHRKSLSAIKIHDIHFFVDSALASNNGQKMEGIALRIHKNELVIDSLKIAEEDGTRVAIYGLKINFGSSASSDNKPDTQQSFSIKIDAIE